MGNTRRGLGAPAATGAGDATVQVLSKSVRMYKDRLARVGDERHYLKASAADLRHGLAKVVDRVTALERPEKQQGPHAGRSDRGTTPGQTQDSQLQRHPRTWRITPEGNRLRA